MEDFMFDGWYQVAFSREIVSDITPLMVGSLPLVIVRTPQGIRIFDAVCPHRGAHLGYGGELNNEAIICPFHGHRISLGLQTKSEFSVREYQTLEMGGMLFVLLSEEHENGFTHFMRSIAETHCFVPGLSLPARVSPELVIENAFDADHFRTVHGINNRPTLKVRPSESGELAVESIFHVERPTAWTASTDLMQNADLHFLARAFSPTLVATELGTVGHSHVIFTAATPNVDATCTIRVSAAVAVDENGEPPRMEVIRMLLHDSKKAFDQDMVVWEHLIAGAPQRFTPSDHPIVEYHKFCERFLQEKPS
jgi:phenylpropionate dioxygenase-like ring-hydroxylating dioxygenase large terminal subunit